MNGHRQSGGHWNAAFGLVRVGSGGLGTSVICSGSGSEAAKCTLFTMGAYKSVAQRSISLRHQDEHADSGGRYELLSHPFLDVSDDSLTLQRNVGDVCALLHIHESNW
jgi:hypothetical protein